MSCLTADISRTKAVSVNGSREAVLSVVARRQNILVRAVTSTPLAVKGTALPPLKCICYSVKEVTPSHDDKPLRVTASVKTLKASGTCKPHLTARCTAKPMLNAKADITGNITAKGWNVSLSAQGEIRSLSTSAEVKMLEAMFLFICPVDLVTSCYGFGYWIEDMPWREDDSWREG